MDLQPSYVNNTLSTYLGHLQLLYQHLRSTHHDVKNLTEEIRLRRFPPLTLYPNCQCNMSPSYTTFYSAQMMLLHTRYGLSSLGKKLLMVYDEYYLGQLSEADLGRTLRYSDGMKRAASETIAKCVDVMGKHPEEQKRCVQIIHACTKMLELSGKPQSSQFILNRQRLDICAYPG